MSLQTNRPHDHYAGVFPAVIPQIRPMIKPRSLRLFWCASAVFFALLLEGIARKWVFTDYHQYFYFFRDPFLLWLYAVAIQRGVLKLDGWFALWLGAAVFVSLLSLLVYT